MNRLIVRILPAKDTGWRVTGIATAQTWWSAKRLAVAFCVDFCRKHAAGGGTASLRVHRRSKPGEKARGHPFQWERTYPRSSDPRRTKG